jgi:hypothetical protein
LEIISTTGKWGLRPGSRPLQFPSSPPTLRGSIQLRFIDHGCATIDKTLNVLTRFDAD